MKSEITMDQQTSLQRFMKMQANEKTSTLTKNGQLLDSYSHNGQKTNLYYLNGFFVEETIDLLTNKLIDLIPYKHGFRLNSYVTAAQHESRPSAILNSIRFLN